MELLPREHKQFQDESYWAKFFADKKTQQGFEWYASFEELEHNLKMTLKDKDQRILVVGCGNSQLSEKMHTKMSIDKITSIDFEEAVIRKMNNKGLPIPFVHMDALNMTFEDSAFDYAIDKGTLDAICSDSSPETAAKVVKYLNEVTRVIEQKGGMLIIVSLLQDFILDALISFYMKGLGNEHYNSNIIDFRIQRMDRRLKKGESKEESHFLPFFVTIKRTSINPEDAKMLELRDKLSQVVSYIENPVAKAQLIDVKEIQDLVKREQINHAMAPQLKDLHLGQKFELFCFDKTTYGKEGAKPRYTLTVVDSSDAKVLKQRTCAAFITPQGKERESIVSTEVGKENLSNQAGYSRLIIITLNHGHKFESIETVKNELSPKVLELAPSPCTNYKEIPFLTIGKDIGERGQVFTSEDGNIFVEDLKDEQNNIYRQVIFSSKPDTIQSEVLLVYRDPKKNQIPDNLKVQSQIAPKKKQRVLTINHDLLCSEYQYSMLTGLALASNLVNKNDLRVLVLGTGAGLLPMFLKNQLASRLSEIVAVDVNEQVVKIGQDFFGLVLDEKLKSVIADAYDFVNTYSGPKFDIIIMDINYEESNLMLTPPRKFLETDFLSNLTGMLSAEGFLTFNTLSYDTQTKNEIFSLIGATPRAYKYHIDGEEDVNRVIHILKQEAPAEDLRLIQMEKVCKEWGLNKGLWLTEMRIKQKIDKVQEIK